MHLPDSCLQQTDPVNIKSNIAAPAGQCLQQKDPVNMKSNLAAPGIQYYSATTASAGSNTPEFALTNLQRQSH